MCKLGFLTTLVLVTACGGRSTAPASAHDPGPIPFHGMTGRTYAVATVEAYPNGLSLVQHPLGDSAAAKLQSAGWKGSRLKDAEVMPSLFVGLHDFPDLLVFGGHGTHSGPSLTTDPGSTMVPESYFRGTSRDHPLRWF